MRKTSRLLKIGYKKYRMKFVAGFKKDKAQLGSCSNPMSKSDNSRGLILIKTGQEPLESASTILHEIFHGFVYVSGLQLKSKDEEQIVSAFSNGLVAFIRDNPRLSKAILRMIQNAQ